MNNNISEYLFRYAENPDPKYAVMLKGKWGCGKSYFINNWLEEFNEKYKDGSQTLEPIYVSLYGLKSVDHITRAIDQQLHPYLYSKGAEFTKKLFKVAGKIAFKTTIDWNNDDKEDMSFDATLDSLSLLTAKDDEITGTKIIVFDDLERCMIDMKLLLGYINNFVEHGACHVVIVGDETHATDESKKNILEFKEKTVGREFEIMPDTEGAVHFFLNDDVSMSEWLKIQESFIIEVFLSTQCDNLRLLRQCLYDFNTIFQEVDNELLNNGNSVLLGLLGSYIVTYCEYRGTYHDVIKDWLGSYLGGLSGNEDRKNKISKLQTKYSSITNKYLFDFLNPNHIKNIVHEIETGCSLKAYVEEILGLQQRNMTKQDKLATFHGMSGADFDVLCNSLVDDIQEHTITDLYTLGRSMALLAFFDNEKMFWMPQAAISIAKRTVLEIFHSITDKDKLYMARTALSHGCVSFMQFYETPIGEDFSKYVNSEFDKLSDSLPNRMEIALKSLSDENVSELQNLSDESTPDHHSDYSLTSIFKNIDPDQLCENISKLSNAGLTEMCDFIRLHYRLGCMLGSGCNHYSDDWHTLSAVNNKLSVVFSSRKGIDKYTANRFLKHLNAALMRAEGENDAIVV